MGRISEKINLELFFKKIKQIPKLKNNTYIWIYPHLIEFIKNIKWKNIDSIIAISHIVYWWMPTILKKCDFQKINIKENELFNKIKEWNLDENFLYEIVKLNNNSIIGGSKFLHFINPEKYAIWDSKVYKSIMNKNSAHQTINNIKKYIEYNNSIKKIAFNEKVKVDELKEKLIKLGYCNNKTTNMRVLELILFYT